MKRHKQIVIVSHCILNQNAVVYPLARAKGAFNEVLIQYLQEDYGIYQLPCPELKYMGLTRKPMSKEDYNTPVYLDLCDTLADEVISDLKHYVDDNVQIDCLHGINQSPTCSISSTRGHFMASLIPRLEALLESISFMEIPTSYEE